MLHYVLLIRRYLSLQINHQTLTQTNMVSINLFYINEGHLLKVSSYCMLASLSALEASCCFLSGKSWLHLYIMKSILLCSEGCRSACFCWRLYHTLFEVMPQICSQWCFFFMCWNKVFQSSLYFWFNVKCTVIFLPSIHLLLMARANINIQYMYICIYVCVHVCLYVCMHIYYVRMQCMWV